MRSAVYARQMVAEILTTATYRRPSSGKVSVLVSDIDAIESFRDEVIAAHPGLANDFKSGKVAALNFLNGQVMKLSEGTPNPALVREILEQELQA